jgi:selenocysteine lyase/cysteine desulfurase
MPSLIVATGFLESGGLARALEAMESRDAVSKSHDDLARDEDFWFEVQQAFAVDRTIVNLNNGGVSPSPLVVNNAMKRYLDYSNMAPVYTMWKILEPQRETVRTRLAGVFGCDPEEVALTRNASEGLQICQFGFDLNPGDEVLTTNQDYPRMITTWKQCERRNGVVLKEFSIPVPAEDEGEIVSLFEQNITPRTRLVLMCHMINLTGQILPVRKVTGMARKKGIPVIVDGAHSFAHFEFSQKDLDCDYFATSLHKWLFAPHGAGMLYVKKEKVASLWPMMAAPDGMDADIRKFEEIGTHPAAGYLAIGDALTFHEGIGAARKEARMRYLRDYWVRRLMEDPRVKLNTSLDPRFSCGLANIQVRDLDSEKLSTFLWEEHRILVTPIKHKEFEGIRVTPSVYTTLEELDRFGDALESVIRSGLPT